MIRLVLIVLLASSTATAQHNSHDHSAGGQSMAVPEEPGQGAFASIAEIVALLRADSDTNWSRVDIAGLRQHLIDMDNLITHAEATVEQVPHGVMFRVGLTGPGGEAVRRMVPAHAPALAIETGWSSVAAIGRHEVTWTVTSSDEVDVIRALGFVGLMAVGGHHQAHHLGMATGEMVH
ncbi:hypothetical protein [Aliiroseovarius subalbicans]|jgi:hypothetical protein|uniref:hypothetical protein n=1 Tax=Aliiroseovarius subalbicans TaxID=2925840 RepID=UPI001F5863EF|nr:hypothetical protein [Aliiroseovarius subalbicans]MCI2401026.1 hypothetical protein [Aliiroseovarius subalbicans]